MDYSNFPLSKLRKVITIKSSSSEDIEFSWKVVEVGTDYVDIQLVFDNPLLISRDGHLDSFTVEIDT